ncbi:Hypothetical protein PHPALM_6550 [Phytophthora palmivora]|uniref:Uncharacterized protein n=1 Tax=Phytophthora palmivora TaxID=4796 RepID=A0A2P4YEK9_9STRA|nr:Hypothetical protein PHPALM_6550 [Phytophthora palmivora]
MAQRDEMEAAFAKLIYCTTQSKFDSEAATFARICKKECPELLQYFQKNWKTCVKMWANHALVILLCWKFDHKSHRIELEST